MIVVSHHIFINYEKIRFSRARCAKIADLSTQVAALHKI